MRYHGFRFIFYFIFYTAIAVYALITARGKRHYGHHRSLYCPNCRRRFPKLVNQKSGDTIPTGGFVCEHCGCRMDEFGNLISYSDDPNDSRNW